jgi:general secretion pathway protein D
MRAVWPLIFLSAICAIGAAATDKETLREARSAYDKALVLLQDKRAMEASILLDEAVSLAPENQDYLRARELARQQVVNDHINLGEKFLLNGSPQLAAIDFREALALDPQNQLAADRLRSTMSILDSRGSSPWRFKYRDEPEIVLTPSQAKKEFHVRGDSRGLLEQVFKAYDITPILDSSVTSAPVRFDIDAIDFARATTLVEQITKTFHVTLSPKQVIVLADTQENRRQYERLSVRSFYLYETASPQDINDLVGMLRMMFDMRFVAISASQRAISVRAPRETLELATRILDDLSNGKPQVTLDVKVYQIDRTFTRNLGVNLPLQFTLFNFNTELANLLKNANQDLINQLIASGAINQADVSAIAALLAALASQGNSIVNQPIVLFGGGITRSGLIAPPASLNLSLNESSIRNLEHVNLRAEQGSAATFRVGTRYPILNASFAPLASSPAINRVLQNQSFQAPFPSFNYEDLGLTLKATPQVHGIKDVTMQVEMQIRGLGAQSFNGVPVITNREYKGTVSLLNGETAVLAGSVSESEQRSLRGVPGLVKVPVIRDLTSATTKSVDASEILVTITPSIIRSSLHDPSTGQAFAPPAK